MSELVNGRIIKGIGGFYYIDTSGKTVECRARGKFRKMGIKPVVGDLVTLTLQDENHGYLQEILPRKNELIRPPISNLDTLVIVVSLASPVTDVFLIDRVSAIATLMGIEVIIAINKCDENTGDELYDIYSKVGFKTLRVSAKSGEGIDELLKCLAGKFSAFTGNSGVGKSTMLNAIEPRFELETGDLNDKIGRGRHTTRHVEIFRIAEDTFIADTPGFSSFDTERMELTTPSDLERAFPEFAKYIDKCEFIGCTHRGDRGCAVCEAAEKGEISKSRMDSYSRLYESLKEIKPWEKRV